MQRQGKIMFVGAIALVILLGMLVIKSGILGLQPTQDRKLPKEEAALRYPYQQLSTKEQTLYAALYEAMAAHQTTFTLPYECTGDEYEKIYLLVRMQEPQFFYVADTYQMAQIMTEIELQYDETEEEAEPMAEAIEQAADEIAAEVAGISDEGRKFLAIHDAIAERCLYEKSAHSSDIYGCLVEGVAQCEGYSKAFCYVARKAGLNVMTITGKSERGLGHAWNIAEIDGAYYNIDVTWDDEDNYEDAVSHRCYAMPDARFGGHTAEEPAFKVPQCTEDKENYYLKYGRILNESSQMSTKCSEWALDQTGNNTFIEFYCPTDEIYQAVVSDVRSGSEIKKAIAEYCTKGVFQFSKDDRGRIVGILFG